MNANINLEAKAIVEKIREAYGIDGTTISQKEWDRIAKKYIEGHNCDYGVIECIARHPTTPFSLIKKMYENPHVDMSKKIDTIASLSGLVMVRGDVPKTFLQEKVLPCAYIAEIQEILAKARKENKWLPCQLLDALCEHKNSAIRHQAIPLRWQDPMSSMEDVHKALEKFEGEDEIENERVRAAFADNIFIDNDTKNYVFGLGASFSHIEQPTYKMTGDMYQAAVELLWETNSQEVDMTSLETQEMANEALLVLRQIFSKTPMKLSSAHQLDFHARCESLFKGGPSDNIIDGLSLDTPIKKLYLMMLSFTNSQEVIKAAWQLDIREVKTRVAKNKYAPLAIREEYVKEYVKEFIENPNKGFSDRFSAVPIILKNGPINLDLYKQLMKINKLSVASAQYIPNEILGELAKEKNTMHGIVANINMKLCNPGLLTHEQLEKIKGVLYSSNEFANPQKIIRNLPIEGTVPLVFKTIEDALDNYGTEAEKARFSMYLEMSEKACTISDLIKRKYPNVLYMVEPDIATAQDGSTTTRHTNSTYRWRYKPEAVAEMSRDKVEQMMRELAPYIMSDIKTQVSELLLSPSLYNIYCEWDVAQTLIDVIHMIDKETVSKEDVEADKSH